MSAPVLPRSLIDRYEELVTRGVIERDPAQVSVVRQLASLADSLAAARLARKGSPLGWLFARRARPDAVRGLYLWGAVGRGKTMLMDLFFDSLPPGDKRRVHFHTFMADVHERIHAFRLAAKAGRAKDGDPIPVVAEALAAEARILCFDEFTVTDIADAMILGRLFTAMFERGVTMVATSNVEPDRLYEGGLNRALFLPFITLLKERVAVVRLDARTDFRLEKLGGAAVYHAPADEAARSALDEAFRRLTGQERGEPVLLSVQGHDVDVPEAARGVARFGFDDLCRRPYGAADYLTLARAFHTILIDAIPAMAFEQRNEAKRFIILIDTLYENRVKLIVSAEAEAEHLYAADSGREAFEFDRTVSRLIEMRSTDYLALPHGRGDAASGATTGLVET